MRPRLSTLFLLLFTTLATYNYLFAAPTNRASLSLSEHISISNGLSDNGVSAIFRDSRGYIWIATYNGLNCYNGYLVTRYINNLQDHFLPSNRVRAINEDHTGRLWIGTDEGLVVYDYNNDSFIIRDKFDKGGIIRNIVIDNDLVYVISESNGILIYDMQFNFVGCDSLDDHTSFSEYIKVDNSLLIASSDGIVEYNIPKHRFKKHLAEELLYLNTIIIDPTKKRIFTGGEGGLAKVNISTKNGSVELSIAEPIDTKHEIKSLAIDSRGALWIGTMFDGIVCIDDYKEIDHNTEQSHLPYRRISGFLEATNGDMLISTFDDGVSRFTTTKEVFISPTEYRPLRMALICMLDQERLLIKSNRIVHIFNTKSLTYEQVPNALKRLFLDNTGIHMVDSKQRIWLVGPNGCFRYNTTNNTVENLNNTEILYLNATTPSAISQDADGNIWVGCTDNLFRISIDEKDEVKRVESIFSNQYFADIELSRVRKIYHDTVTNCTWFGTDTQGLYIISTPSGSSLRTAKVEHYIHDKNDNKSLPSNFVSSILRDQSGTMWIGTEQGGLCRTIEREDGLQFDTFSTQHGMSSNIVKAIQCDSKGRLWIPTSVGLNSFDPTKEQFRTYRDVDGLPFDEFLYSSVKNTNGEIFFTGTNKFLFFNPDELSDSEEIPELYFRGLNIYDRPVNPNKPFDGRTIITNRLSDGDFFKLKHNQNTFSIGIDVIYGQNTSYHHYHYMLEPINNQWITNDVANNSISFNGLKPGRYTLRVKASNSYGDMTPEKKLHIKIKRPFYSSIIACTIYVLLLAAAIIFVFYFMMHNQALRHSLILEAQEKESLRKANLEKQQYFSNISHELKTPLTLIMAPLSIMTERFKLDVNIKTNLTIMQRQVRKMLQLIDLAHGIQLSDENRLELNVEKFIVRDFLKEIYADFEFLAQFDNKSFNIEYPDAVLSVEADRSMLEKILNNLLSNAFKYTSGGDTIAVSYVSDGRLLTLKVSDNGTGIQREDLPRIFDRFYTSKSIETKKVGGTGIGLAFSKYMVELHGGEIKAESVYGQGTTFTVELPIVVAENKLSTYNEIEDETTNEKPLIMGSLELGDSIEVDPALKERLVFVVEDNGEVRAFISDIVSKYFKVESYASAKECLEAMESQWPDIIVSDVMMPEMNGDKLCEIIKSDIRTSHIPVILLTARYTVDDKIKGIELGADSYIGKPFYPKHLITRISSLLKGRQRLFEHFQKGLSYKQSSVGGVSTRDSKLLSSLYALFEKNLDNDMVELDSFAVELGLNRSLFYSKIKALTDISPYELLKKYRLQRANELILSGKYNISEVCDMTGFKSRTHFSRVYKDTFGVTPSKALPK